MSAQNVISVSRSFLTKGEIITECINAMLCGPYSDQTRTLRDLYLVSTHVLGSHAIG